MRKTVSLSFLDQSITNTKYDIYLGRWCFEINPGGDEDVLENPITDTHTLEAQSVYLDNLTDLICDSLVPVFNDYYEVSFSKRYWRIVLIPFLAHWISSNYYKYLVLQNLKKRVTELDALPVFNFINKQEGNWDYQLTSEYINCCTEDDAFIHFEFQTLALYVFGESLILNREPLPFKKVNFQRKKSFLEKARALILVASGFGGSYHLGRIYFFSLKEKILIHSNLFRWSFPSFLKFFFTEGLEQWSEISSSKDFELVAQKWNFSPQNDFENFVYKNLLQAFPKSLKSKIPRQPFIKRVKSVITNVIYCDQDDLFFIARVVENGGKWFSPQHGGGYGVSKNFSLHTFHYVDCDKFLTWGWQNHGRYKIKPHPLSSPMLSKLPKYQSRNYSDILFVTTLAGKINFRFDSYLTINSRGDYRKTQLSFLSSLDQIRRSCVVYREHFSKFEHADELNIFLVENKIRSCEELASKRALTSKLVVIDHPGTTPLQTYAMNVPTIMYWPESYFDLTVEAYEDFKHLKNHKMWFNSEVEAAQFINQHYENIAEWWFSKEVQAVKDSFVKKYALNSKDFLNEWVNFIKENC